MVIEFNWFNKMSKAKRAWVRELIERFGWSVRVAIQQVHFFGINKNWVYNYRTNELVEQA